jgi:hypothetical protein
MRGTPASKSTSPTTSSGFGTPLADGPMHTLSATATKGRTKVSVAVRQVAGNVRGGKGRYSD